MADGSVLAGNLPGSPRNPLRDPGTEVEAPINAPVDCQGWRRLESTHMEHLPLDGPPEDLLTEEEAEDNDSLITEDLTVYHSAEEEKKDLHQSSPPNLEEDNSTGLRLSTMTPTNVEPPGRRNNSVTSATMSAKMLFSVGKRRSLLPQQSRRRPILAVASSEEEEEFQNAELFRNRSRKMSRRKSVLGRHVVTLLPSDSDVEENADPHDLTEDGKESHVRRWINTSPFGKPKKPPRKLNDLKTVKVITLDDSTASREADDITVNSSEATSRNLNYASVHDVTSSPEGTSHELGVMFGRDEAVQQASPKSGDVRGDTSEKRDNHRVKSYKKAKTCQKSVQVSLSESEEETRLIYEEDSTTVARDNSLSLEKTLILDSPRESPERRLSPALKERSQDISTSIEISPEEASDRRVETAIKKSAKVSADDSSSGDEELEKYLKMLRERRKNNLEEEERRRLRAEETPLEEFIVDDDEDDLSDSCSDGDKTEEEDAADDINAGFFDEEATSSQGSEEASEEETDSDENGNSSKETKGFPKTIFRIPKVLSSSDSENENQEPLDVQFDEPFKIPPPTPTRKPERTKSPGIINTPRHHPRPRPGALKPLQDRPTPQIRTQTFLQSLSLMQVDETCHPTAVPYVNRYTANRDDLTHKLFRLFNEEIFCCSLDPNMPITWCPRLTKTAGLCYQKWKLSTDGKKEGVRTSSIKLSEKVLDSPDRLRDTLIHEMCHAASWVITGYKDGHGPIWKDWARRCTARFPELPLVSRCHTYKIRTKYSYQCMSCGYSVNRHSKSIDLNRFRCGRCGGNFQLFLNKIAGVTSDTPGRRTVSTPATPARNKFAAFVKDNYKYVRKEGVAHADAMKELGKMFAATKIQT